MQNTEISRHPKSSKLSLYIPNPVYNPRTTATLDQQHTIFRYSFNKSKYIWEKLYQKPLH